MNHLRSPARHNPRAWSYQLGFSALAAIALAGGTLCADEPAVRPGRLWLLTIAGLGGDDQQSGRFQAVITAYRDWASDRLEVPAERLLTVPEVQADGKPGLGATRESLESTFNDLAVRLSADDSLWVIVIAHGNYDGRDAFFHLAGPDPPATDWARWLDACRCREQLIVLAGAGSGWFLRPLSKKGRIVVTATAADDEFNATEFPAAFADIIARPLDKLDGDGNGRVSVAELFTATVDEVERRFVTDERIATEHAQLDDDGDGRGSERDAVARILKSHGEGESRERPDTSVAAEAGRAPAPKPASAPNERIDGVVAAKCLVPFRRSAAAKPTEGPGTVSQPEESPP